MDPPKLRIALPRGRATQGRVGAPPLTHLRGVSRHCIQQKRCFAAEVWDAKGLAVPTLGYVSRCRAQTLGGLTSGLTQDWTALPSSRFAPIKPRATTSSESSRRYAAEEWGMRGR